MTEEWKNIRGYTGFYQVSNFGKIKSVSRIIKKNDGKILTLKERVLRQSLNTKGYPYINLCRNCICISKTIHIIVARAFVSNPKRKPQVNHKDGNKLNNNDWNLEWNTNKENSIHAIKNKLKIRSKKGTFKKITKWNNLS